LSKYTSTPSGQVSRRAVADAGVEAELFGHPPALLVGAGDADHAAAPDLGDLTHQRARRPGRRRHHDGLARLGPADLEEPGVGGRPGGAEHAHHREQLGAGRKPGGEHVVAHHGVLLPTREGDGHVADGVGVAPGGHHHAGAAAAHDLPDVDRGQVALPPVEPGPNRRVHAQVHRPQERLAVGELVHGRFHEFEVLVGHETLRAPGQPELTVRGRQLGGGCSGG
jgi:hypothetical protein